MAKEARTVEHDDATYVHQDDIMKYLARNGDLYIAIDYLTESGGYRVFSDDSDGRSEAVDWLQDNGKLVFDDDGEGARQMRDYLQDCTDYYVTDLSDAGDVKDSIEFFMDGYPEAFSEVAGSSIKPAAAPVTLDNNQCIVSLSNGAKIVAFDGGGVMQVRHAPGKDGGNIILSITKDGVKRMSGYDGGEHPLPYQPGSSLVKDANAADGVQIPESMLKQANAMLVFDRNSVAVHVQDASIRKPTLEEALAESEVHLQAAAHDVLMTNA
jgi:hypothetical protein